jgi:hypothetical protein
MHCIRHNFSGTGDEFVIVDESSKNEHSYARRYGLAPVRQDATLTTPFIQGQCYSLVAAMSKAGYLAAHVVRGLISAPPIPVGLRGVRRNPGGVKFGRKAC